jgi:hypothetical protein
VRESVCVRERESERVRVREFIRNNTATAAEHLLGPRGTLQSVLAVLSGAKMNSSSPSANCTHSHTHTDSQAPTHAHARAHTHTHTHKHTQTHIRTDKHT